MRGLLVLKSSAAVNYFPFDSLSSARQRKGERVCVRTSVFVVYMAGVAGQVVTDQWECPHEAPRWKVWPLLHRLECISPNRKNHILITFYFISVFFFNPPLLCSSLKTSSSPSTSPLNTELPLHLPFSVLESDCLFSQIVVHSLLALSVSFLNPSHPRSLI